eukprot:1146423-Pelagomonas_calceolata.AAC.10
MPCVSCVGWCAAQPHTRHVLPGLSWLKFGKKATHQADCNIRKTEVAAHHRCAAATDPPPHLSGIEGSLCCLCISMLGTQPTQKCTLQSAPRSAPSTQSSVCVLGLLMISAEGLLLRPWSCAKRNLKFATLQSNSDASQAINPEHAHDAAWLQAPKLVDQAPPRSVRVPGSLPRPV